MLVLQGYELYNLTSDPWEVDNIYDEAPRVHRDMPPEFGLWCCWASAGHCLPTEY